MNFPPLNNNNLMGLIYKNHWLDWIKQYLVISVLQKSEILGQYYFEYIRY